MEVVRVLILARESRLQAVRTTMLNFHLAIQGHSIINMNPPPPIEILKKLMHSDIDSICYGLSTVSIRFATNNNLSFSSPFRFADVQGAKDAPILDFPLKQSQIVRILGCQITEISCEADGTLSLLFSNEDLLVVYANEPGYEAYTILMDGKEYRV
jgi:hypothetical protein